MQYNQENLFDQTQTLISSQSKILDERIESLCVERLEVETFMSYMVSNICEEFEVYDYLYFCMIIKVIRLM